MNAFPRCFRFAWLAAFALLVGPAPAQQQSVRPGINKQYESPDLPTELKRLECDNREAFAHRTEIVAACKLKPGTTVADIGAGTGLFTRLLAAEVGPRGRVFAVDIAPKFLEHVAKTCKDAGLQNVTTVACTPTSTELPPGSIDVAFICDTYHHFEFPQKTLASIHQSLRPGGRVILVDYRRIEGKTAKWLMDHVRAGQEVVTQEVEAAGFKRVDEPLSLKDNYFVRFEKNACVAGQRQR